MTINEHENKMDEGYQVRLFDSELKQSDWLYDLPRYDDAGDRYDAVVEKVESTEGKEKFYNFLNMMNSAPSLNTLSEKADKDVNSLFENPDLRNAIRDVFFIGWREDVSPETVAAKKTLEGLINKGYPSAQCLYAELLIDRGQTRQAREILRMLNTNRYIGEEDESHADFLEKWKLKFKEDDKKEENLKERLAKLQKIPSFLERANSAKNLDDVSEENLSAEMDRVQQLIFEKRFIKGFDPTSEEEKAFVIFSQKNYPSAQDYLIRYYIDKKQYSKAFSMADRLRRNPYANEFDQEHGEKNAKELLAFMKATHNYGR